MISVVEKISTQVGLQADLPSSPPACHLPADLQLFLAASIHLRDPEGHGGVPRGNEDTEGH